MMYPYAIGSTFAFLCMIAGVLLGQLMGSDEPSPEQERLLDESLTEEEQETVEELLETVENLKED